MPEVDPAGDPAAVAAFIRACAADPVFADGLALASPPAAAATAAFVHDGGSAGEAVKLALTLSRYVSRMSARATPFGLFAGVALARPGPRLELSLGTGHRKFVRPDGGRLTGLARTLETTPDVLPRLRIAVHPHCRVRGSRLVLPTPSSGDVGQTGTLSPLSVRRNPAVDAILDLCRDSRPAGEVAA
ncbi:MAG TPA: lantibiotic dehydratase, partial [Phytomonospora sp.]